MNFEQWYKQNSWEDYPPNYSRAAWGACKEEVLKLIKKHKERKCRGVLVDEIVEDIKKL